MRKNLKILVIGMIAILALGMLSACGGKNYTNKDIGFTGQVHGISKSVKDTTENVIVATNEITNYVDAE